MKTGLSSLTVVPLQPIFDPMNSAIATMVRHPALPVCNAELKIDDLGRHATKGFTLRDNISGADQ